MVIDGSWLEDHTIQQSNKSPQKNSWLEAYLQETQLSIRSQSKIEFPDKLIQEETNRIIEEFLKLSYKSRPSFKHFAKRHIKKTFIWYNVVSQKKLTEDNRIKLTKQDKIINTDIRELEEKLRREQKRLSDAEILINNNIARAYSEIRQIDQEIKAEIDKIEKGYLESYYQEKLSNYPIKPNMIHGIGTARIDALNSVGIYTAADIVTTNYAKSLNALAKVRNSDARSDWYKLEQWRKNHEQNIPKPYPKRIRPIEVKKIEDNYSEKKRFLTSNMTNQQKHLDQIKDERLIIEKTLLQQIAEQKEIKIRIEKQIKIANEDFTRYSDITHQNFLKYIILEVKKLDQDKLSELKNSRKSILYRLTCNALIVSAFLVISLLVFLHLT